MKLYEGMKEVRFDIVRKIHNELRKRKIKEVSPNFIADIAYGLGYTDLKSIEIVYISDTYNFKKPIFNEMKGK